MFLYVFLTLAILIVGTVLPLKAIIGRERPSRIVSVHRILNMRDLEHGKAMPSGDSACGAYFCCMYSIMFGFHWAVLIIPLVCLGRVYVHCHWIGDTVAGSILGSITAYVFFSLQFETVSKPLYQIIFK